MYHLKIQKTGIFSSYQFLAMAAILVLYGLSISSCTKEVDEVIGTWELTDWSLSGCPDSSDNFSLSFGPDGCISSAGESLCSTVRQTFNEDGTYSVTGGITESGRTLISAMDRGTWQRVGGVLEICDSDGECNTDITTRINGDRATVIRGLNGCTSTQTYERL